MMADIRLVGAANRLLFLTSNTVGQVLRIEFAEGEELPAGELVATATSGDDVIDLFPEEEEASAGVLVEVPLYTDDFDEYGQRDWQLVVAVQDYGSIGSEEGSSGDEDDVRYILFTGTLRFIVIPPRVITSTTFVPLGS
jgi:hypothetical protein